jgi:branched-chain amino acid transport system permease protein
VSSSFPGRIRCVRRAVLAILQTGRAGTVWLLLILAAVAALMQVWGEWQRHHHALLALKSGLRTLAFPVVAAAVTAFAAPRQPHLAVQALLSVAVVTAYGPLVYRVAFQSLAHASPLVLLIVSVGVHFAMTGLGLLFFGAEGYRNPSFWDLRIPLGIVNLTGQAIIIALASIALILMLWLFFERTLRGKAARATARTGSGRGSWVSPRSPPAS